MLRPALGAGVQRRFVITTFARPDRDGAIVRSGNVVMWYLMAAILFEVAGTTSMKLSAGFTRLGPSLAMGVFYALSLAALTFAVRRIEIGVAYAVWAGLGTALIAVIGILWFRESASAAKLACLALIILGVAGLQYLESPQPPSPEAAVGAPHAARLP